MIGFIVSNQFLIDALPSTDSVNRRKFSFICSRDWPISPPSPAPILKMLNSAIPRSAVHLIRPLVTV